VKELVGCARDPASLPDAQLTKLFRTLGLLLADDAAKQHFAEGGGVEAVVGAFRLRFGVQFDRR
jgi:hypothetical protein